MKYYSIFKDLNNNDIKIEIITESIGQDTELYVAAGGLRINYNGDKLYTPILKSGCSIDFLIQDIIPDFYSGTLLKPEVYIYKNNELFWFGYVTPNAYNQPYCMPYDNITIECIDTLAQANNVDYSYIVNYANQPTFIEIIEHILDKVDPNKHITKIFCSNSISLNSNNNILELLSINERNFYDEIDEAAKGDECIESICTYLGFTMFQYKDAYYIVDYNNLDSTYTVYNRTTNSSTNQLSSTARTISSIGVTNSDTNISYEGLYNKVSIVANTLKMDDPISSDNDYKGDLFGDLVQNSTYTSGYQGSEERSVWINPEVSSNTSDYALYLYDQFSQDPYHYPKHEHIWSFDNTQDWDEYKLLVSWWKSDGDWNFKYPQMRYNPNTLDLTEYTGTMSIGNGYSSQVTGGAYEIRNYQVDGWLTWAQGTMWQKVASYKVEDGMPTSLDFKEYFTISCQTTHDGIEDKFLSYENPSMLFRGGAFMINFEFYFSNNNTIAMSEMHEPPVKYDDSISNDTPTSKKERRIVFPAKLSVGDYYWNGAEWRQYTETFLAKLNAGYFDYTLHSFESTTAEPLYVDGRDWLKHIWRVWNSTYQDWDYVTETEFISRGGNPNDIIDIPTSTDTFGNEYISPTKLIYYITKNVNNSTIYIQVPATYQNQFVSDRFYLAKKFPNGGNMYGTPYKLDNTTTYLMNLNEASEGIALVIPEDLTLTGTFKFSVGRPTRHFEALTPNATCGESVGNLVIHISDMYIKYSQQGEITTSNDDIVYSNVINSGYINELEDVQMRVNTYTNKMMSYSYVLNNGDFLDTLTYNNKTQMQEYNIIEKLVNHYSTKKLVYSSTIYNDNITPCSILTDTHLNKTFPVVGVQYNMCSNFATVTCIEI